jgi:hypothetical protein
VSPVDGLNVYPAEATIWLNVVSLVLPSTDTVSVRVLHEDDARAGARLAAGRPPRLGSVS